jgi:non-specific serine/threonine protein kinase
VILGLVVAVTTGMLIAAAAGVGVPQSVRNRLGFGESADGTAPCTPDPSLVRAPSQPASDGAGAWRAEPPLPRLRDEPKAIRRGDEIWVLGGAVPLNDEVGSLADVLAFDPATGRYRRMPSLPEPLDHVASGAYLGDVLVAGGYTATHSSARAWRYSASRRAWSRAPSLPRPSAAPGSAMIGSRLYVAGGTPISSFAPDILDRQPLGNLEAYDFRTGRWTELAPMPTPRHHVALVALGGKLYAIGGRAQGDFSSPAVERYDPRTDTWTELRQMPQGVGGPAATSAGGRIIVAGGGDDAERWISPASWSYEPARDRWTRLADLREPRHGAALVAAAGRAYLLGGAPCPGFGLARTVESLALPG